VKGRIFCQARWSRFIGYIGTIYQFMLAFHQVHLEELQVRRDLSHLAPCPGATKYSPSLREQVIVGVEMNPLRLDEAVGELGERRLDPAHAVPVPSPHTWQPRRAGDGCIVTRHFSPHGGRRGCKPRRCDDHPRPTPVKHSTYPKVCPNFSGHATTDFKVKRGRYNIHLIDNLSPSTYYLCELLNKRPGLVRGKRVRFPPSRRR
jgi:hypothetical protein